jgi:hypothetical protein
MGRELQQHMLPDSTFSLLISARPYIDCPGASPLLCLSIIDSCLDIEHLHAQESFLTTTTPPCLSSSAPPAPRATSPSPSTAPSPRPPSSTSKKPRAVRPPLLLLLPLLPPLANPPLPRQTSPAKATATRHTSKTSCVARKQASTFGNRSWRRRVRRMWRRIGGSIGGRWSCRGRRRIWLR